MSAVLHALSFDIEEYFQVLNLRQQIPRQDWDGHESRVELAMDRILSALDRHRARATMFFLGWVAERHPALVKRCFEAGHEIASHGYEHKLVWEIGREGFEGDLERTELALMAAGAPRPIGFRASTFSVTRKTWWAFEHLARRGYRYDSSVHPVRHPVYGVPGFEPGISRVGSVVEFPVLTTRALGRNWPAGGGGYFRLFPLRYLAWALERSERRGRPAMLYLHPWEFDPQQPRFPASFSRRLRQYHNLDRTLERLEYLLSRHRFGTAQAVLRQGGWL
jgi:polysaccharide deacetylase family protein (PEP-CTERM system associated)